MAAKRWFRPPPVWHGRRFARDIGRLLAAKRRRAAYDVRAPDGPASRKINPASSRARSAGRPAHARGPDLAAALDVQESRKVGGGADRAGVASEFDDGGSLLNRLGYRLQSVRKRQEGTTHPDRNAQFEHCRRSPNNPHLWSLKTPHLDN